LGKRKQKVKGRRKGGQNMNNSAVRAEKRFQKYTPHPHRPAGNRELIPKREKRKKENRRNDRLGFEIYYGDSTRPP